MKVKLTLHLHTKCYGLIKAQKGSFSHFKRILISLSIHWKYTIVIKIYCWTISRIVARNSVMQCIWKGKIKFALSYFLGTLMSIIKRIQSFSRAGSKVNHNVAHLFDMNRYRDLYIENWNSILELKLYYFTIYTIILSIFSLLCSIANKYKIISKTIKYSLW